MARDDIKIIPRIRGPEQTPVRERAAEGRREQRAKRKRGALRKRLRRARRLRQMQQRNARGGSALARRAATRVGAGAGVGRALGGRGGGRGGLVMAALMALDLGGDATRRGLYNVSGRLLGAMDQNDYWGREDENIAGISRGRAALERDPVLLGIIGRQGQVSGGMDALGRYMKERERAIAVGSDLIEREPAFDAMESLSDKAIQGLRDEIIYYGKKAAGVVRRFLGMSGGQGGGSIR